MNSDKIADIKILTHTQFIARIFTNIISQMYLFINYY